MFILSVSSSSSPKDRRLGSYRTGNFRRVAAMLPTANGAALACTICGEQYELPPHERAPYLLSCGKGACGHCLAHYFAPWKVFCPLDGHPIDRSPVLYCEVVEMMMKVRGPPIMTAPVGLRSLSDAAADNGDDDSDSPLLPAVAVEGDDRSDDRTHSDVGAVAPAAAGSDATAVSGGAEGGEAARVVQANGVSSAVSAADGASLSDAAVFDIRAAHRADMERGAPTAMVPIMDAFFASSVGSVRTLQRDVAPPTTPRAAATAASTRVAAPDAAAAAPCLRCGCSPVVLPVTGHQRSCVLHVSGAGASSFVTGPWTINVVTVHVVVDGDGHTSTPLALHCTGRVIDGGQQSSAAAPPPAAGAVAPSAFVPLVCAVKPSRHDACLFDVLYTVPDDAARSVELCLSLSITPGVALAAVDGSDGSGAELSQFTAPTLTVPALRRADTAAASPVGRMVGVVELAVGPAACVAAALDDSVVVVSSPSTHTLTVIDTHSGLILAAMGGRASEPVAVPGLWIGPLGLCFAPPVPVQLAAPGTPAASSTSSSPSRGSVRVLRTAFGTVWSPSAACGDLLVCDCGNNRVVRVTLSGRVVGFVGVGTLVRPWGVAANADVIVVSEPTAGRVVVFQAATGLALSTIGDDGTAAAAGVSPSRLVCPRGVRLMGRGAEVAVVEEGRNRVSVWRLRDAGFVRSVGDGVLVAPMDVHVDGGGGGMVVPDPGHGRICRFDDAGVLVAAWAVERVRWCGVDAGTAGDSSDRAGGGGAAGSAVDDEGSGGGGDGDSDGDSDGGGGGGGDGGTTTDVTAGTSGGTGCVPSSCTFAGGKLFMMNGLGTLCRIYV